MAIVSFTVPGYKGIFSTMIRGSEIIFYPGDNEIPDETADYLESLSGDDWMPRSFMTFKESAPKGQAIEPPATPPPPPATTAPDVVELIPDLDELTADEAVVTIHAVKDPTILDLLHDQEAVGKKRKSVMKAIEARQAE